MQGWLGYPCLCSHDGWRTGGKVIDFTPHGVLTYDRLVFWL